MNRKTLHKSPYARIVEASRKGKGVRLSKSEVYNMATLDDAIKTRGLGDLGEGEAL